LAIASPWLDITHHFSDVTLLARKWVWNWLNSPLRPTQIRAIEIQAFATSFYI
jgi:hypothetical protein